MAKTSANLALTLPESFDKVDVKVLHDNFSLIDAAFDEIIGPDEVANNLITEGAGKVLDARQGKALSDRLVKFEDNIKFTDDSVDVKGKYIDNALFR